MQPLIDSDATPLESLTYVREVEQGPSCIPLHFRVGRVRQREEWPNPTLTNHFHLVGP